MLDFTSLQAFANTGLKVTCIDRNNYLKMAENIVEKGENAGYQHFPLFPQCLKTAFKSFETL